MVMVFLELPLSFSSLEFQLMFLNHNLLLWLCCFLSFDAVHVFDASTLAICIIILIELLWWFFFSFFWRWHIVTLKWRRWWPRFIFAYFRDRRRTLPRWLAGWFNWFGQAESWAVLLTRSFGWHRSFPFLIFASFLLALAVLQRLVCVLLHDFRLAVWILFALLLWYRNGIHLLVWLIFLDELLQTTCHSRGLRFRLCQRLLLLLYRVRFLCFRIILNTFCSLVFFCFSFLFLLNRLLAGAGTFCIVVISLLSCILWMLLWCTSCFSCSFFIFFTPEFVIGHHLRLFFFIFVFLMRCLLASKLIVSLLSFLILALVSHSLAKVIDIVRIFHFFVSLGIFVYSIGSTSVLR